MIKLDISQIIKIGHALPGVQRQLDLAIPPALNVYGGVMYESLVRDLSSTFEVPAGEVSNALDIIPATPGVPAYAITATNVEFPFVVWVTQRDERVCPICGPREGVQYRLNDALQIFPAHPNCRCSLSQSDLVGELMRIAPELLQTAQEAVLQDLSDRFGTIWQSIAP